MMSGRESVTANRWRNDHDNVRYILSLYLVSFFGLWVKKSSVFFFQKHGRRIEN
jgi:hypothetical protein